MDYDGISFPWHSSFEKYYVKFNNLGGGFLPSQSKCPGIPWKKPLFHKIDSNSQLKRATCMTAFSDVIRSKERRYILLKFIKNMLLILCVLLNHTKSVFIHFPRFPQHSPLHWELPDLCGDCQYIRCVVSVYVSGRVCLQWWETQMRSHIGGIDWPKQSAHAWAGSCRWGIGTWCSAGNIV